MTSPIRFWLLALVLATAACTEFESSPSALAQPQLSPHSPTPSAALMPDADFFAMLRFAAVPHSTLQGWARSSCLATLDTIDGVRFSANHYGQLRLYLIDAHRFEADYQEQHWDRLTKRWTVAAPRVIAGSYALTGNGRIVLHGLGHGERRMIGGAPAIVLWLDGNLQSAGAAGQSVIVRHALTSESTDER